jgi:hypothetical protein
LRLCPMVGKRSLYSGDRAYNAQEDLMKESTPNVFLLGWSDVI